jgi:hypothetical protein
MKEDTLKITEHGEGGSKDIESIRQETAMILDKRVREALERYVNKTALGHVAYSIDTDDTSVYTMYVSYYFFENPMAIKDLEIVVHRQRWNDPYLEFALCHELGHLDNALQSRDKKFIDPKNILQKLYIEILADRRAAKIYDDKEGNKVVGQWLKYSIKDCIINHKRAANKKANAKSLLFFIMRYTANILL